MCWWRRGELVWIWSTKWMAWRRGFLGRLVVRGNHVWCLAIYTKFKGLGGANRWGGRRFSSHHTGMTSHKGDESWSNLWLLVTFVFVNSRNITIQGTNKSIKFQKYVLGVRALLQVSRFSWIQYNLLKRRLERWSNC